MDSIFLNKILPKTLETIYPVRRTNIIVNKKPTTQLILLEKGISGKILLIIDWAGPEKKVKINLIIHNVAAIGNIENKPIKK